MLGGPKYPHNLPLCPNPRTGLIVPIPVPPRYLPLSGFNAKITILFKTSVIKRAASPH